MKCIFCKIIKDQIPSEKVYEDKLVLAFRDLNPLAKEHYLFIHKNHTQNINEQVDHEPSELAAIFKAIKAFSESSGLVEDGFRVVTNLGDNAGQTIFHTHFHVLGGEKLGSFGS